ncbi:class I adenylate-forming enzyme family protein [[Mycobacterium] wendilense]|uniref:AMP-binding protein n=1 Tax=[Mycobacterium] wendilense TaxID=3064284 RepID=A0ABN9NTB4_9MYCO|nr:AMP-binding protein [Mycolicibacterium sp. MU0050]CAJ1579097.1 AMP-binding protein [Mycolicibacterium sp. MU0050]
MRPAVSGAQTVASMLSHWSTVTPEAPFLVFDDEDVLTLTYRDGWELAARGSAVLASLGVGHGDRFAVVLGNCVEFFACWFGAARLGAVMVPVNPNSTADELTYFFEHASCRAVICSSRQQDAVRAAWPAEPALIVLCGKDFNDRSSAPPPAPDVTVSPLDPLAVLYTSGTTSRPKGVLVTHANYLAAGHTIAGQLRIRPDDRWLIVLPMFHANAQYYCVMSALVTGASVAVAARFSASHWIQQARRCHATLASLFAAPARMILAQPESATDRDNALRVTIFGQNLTPDQLRRFEDRFGCPLLQLYGMTETIAPPLMNPLYGPRDNMTVGLPTESGRVRIVDDPLDRTAGDLAPGQTGELLIGGEPGITLMAGYLDDPDTTAAAYVDGWLRTGDVVTRRHDEFIAFHDRAKDMIKRSGENVAAAEVERVVNEHPAVFESAVIGVPDPVRDEAIKAVVVRTENGSGLTESALITFCADRLARGKVPDHVEFTENLPRTSVGKIRKNLLRQPISKEED